MSWDVVGQERAVAVLRRAIEDESRLSHAYLFVGPEHVGRSTAARRFAQALNCTAAGERPCGACRSCRLIAEDKHADVEWVSPGGVCEESDHRDHEGSRDIRICQVRRLERVLSRTPMDGRYRVVVIEPADTLTTEAANAFLKTLEEPAPYVVLILITAREEALPETVRSRCRRLVFSGVARAAVEAALRERGADDETASRLAGLAQGRLGWALSALEDEAVLAEREQAIDEVEDVLEGGHVERFSYAGSLGARFSRDPRTVQGALEAWRSWWRDVLLTAAGRPELAVSRERLDTLAVNAAQYGVTGAVQALTAVRAARRHLDEHANPTLALEVMMLDLPAKRRRPE